MRIATPLEGRARSSGFGRASLAPSTPPPSDAVSAAGAQVAPLDFAEVYEELFPLVFRTVRRLVVDASAREDVCQEVFAVVHRRLPEFRGRSSLKTWVFGIVVNVVQAHRRSQRRQSPAHRGTGEIVDPEQLAGPSNLSPYEAMKRAEAARVVHNLLASLDEEKRVVLLLAELEELPASEIAQGIGVNVNTVYARLRAARQAFSDAVQRHHARIRGGRHG
ncbi:MULTISPECIES: RNA polymerase sigma factor [Sorangium]|uniref:ECF-family RNA polymerase sigma factor n=1 Tax=Sorangium cellulosum (strain So ce56) TaxID=448385 RepID=A9FJZ8_SORC5|nr:RNA polymerase sigma factor [Sorangium cellulosum]CAN95064.1 ECF-family RNA polymerase sigma factor [Sorangium cellulosum So ce56]